MKRMIIIMLMAIMMTGCATAKIEGRSEEVTTSRFIELEDTYIFRVVADKETGVMYAVSTGGYSRGVFTLLVDENGKPLIWEGESDEQTD